MILNAHDILLHECKINIYLKLRSRLAFNFHKVYLYINSNIIGIRVDMIYIGNNTSRETLAGERYSD